MTDMPFIIVGWVGTTIALAAYAIGIGVRTRTERSRQTRTGRNDR